MSFDFPQKVLFKHCDPAGIVFFPRYFEMINDCVEAFFEAEIAYPFERMHPASGVPTAEISARFTAPSRHGDRLILRLDCRSVGRTSVTLQIVARCDDEIRFVAQSALVHIDKTGRPSPWPGAARDRLSEHVKEGGEP